MRIGIGLLSVSLAIGAPTQAAEEKWALLIGIDQYQSSDITPLNCAVSDAEGLSQTLIAAAGFPQEHVITLTSPGLESRRPSKAGIIYWLDYLAGEVQPGDLFLFYFGGHGFLREGRSFLVPYDADPRSLETIKASCLSVEELQEALKKIPANQIFILDACRKEPEVQRGTEEGVLTEEFSREFILQPVENQLTATVFACNKGQRSWEWTDQRHGFFTYYLIQGLQGQAAREEGGPVYLRDLEQYLGKTVPAAVKREKGKVQEPWVERAVRAGDLILAPGRTGPPPTGDLEVFSEPPGGQVYVDGQGYGTTPTTVRNLRTGEHEVVVALPGYGEEQRRIVVIAGQANPVTLRLQQVSATLQIQSVPEGAEVQVDGVSRGRTPVQVRSLAPGEHLVRLSLAGYYDYRTAETLTAGETKPVVVNLQPIGVIEEGQAFLSIQSEPAGLTAYLNGRPLGQTPLSLLKVPAGKHRLALRSAEYTDWETEVSVEANKIQKIRHIAARAKGHLTVKTDIPEATIWVDGRQQGRTGEPAVLAGIAVGQHEVEVRWDWGRLSRLVIVPRDNPVVEEFLAAQYVGAVTVLTEAEGGQVTLDGMAVPGEPPLTIEKVPAGLRKVRVVQSLANGRVRYGEAEVAVGAGRTQVVTVDSWQEFHPLINPVDGSELVPIPGGEFVMGGIGGLHKVRLASFYLRPVRGDQCAMEAVCGGESGVEEGGRKGVEVGG